jgi:hypothetical protein
MEIILGKWTEYRLNEILRESAGIKDMRERVDFLSRLFLGVNYQDNTLIGDENTQEVFVINLAGIDCFTFLEYVEAMRCSGSFTEFTENVKKVRYHDGNVRYESRNHFFTDWPEFNSALVKDVTGHIGREQSVTIKKTLNQRKDGTLLLKGIKTRKREVSYIPSNAVNEAVVSRIQTGDYAGIYSELPSLDVSHVGIIIRNRDETWLRHASSSRGQGKVIDQEFRGCIADKPGIVLLRPKGRYGF